MTSAWLLFLHQIPPAPSYLRAKVMRRLHQLGAAPVKNSAYLLPASDDTLEDFQWLRKEIEAGGGEAWVFRCEPAGGISTEAIQEEFRKLRAADYAALSAEARAGAPARKLKRRYEELRRIDFFDAPGREELEVLMQQSERAAAPAAGDYQARTWVTRKGVKVDRIGSAWLIRRFLDPAARFEFVDPETYRHAEREVRFDMFDGEFTHQGDLCTFEVLAGLVGGSNPGLAAIGEIVHDIDLRDGKFGRPEAAGLAALIDGIALRHADDARRIEEGSALFEALYAQFTGGTKS